MLLDRKKRRNLMTDLDSNCRTNAQSGLLRTYLSAQAMSQTTAVVAAPGRVCAPGQRLAAVEALS